VPEVLGVHVIVDNYLTHRHPPVFVAKINAFVQNSDAGDRPLVRTATADSIFT
jgi:hypothetical protein